jgi:hypothetical protein
MLYGALVSMNPHLGEGFDRLSPNGGFFMRWLAAFGLSFSPFGLSLSKPSRGPAQP